MMIKLISRVSVLACLAMIGAHPVMAGGDHRIFELGDFVLESGETLPDAKVSYVTHGTLRGNGENAILVPSAYLGDHHGFDFLIAEGLALDPNEYFIVATDMFQNGLSSSPSNTPEPFSGSDFPTIAIRDNVNAGYRLLTEELGLSKLKAVIGFSMGAQQAFQWAVSHPGFMDKIVGIAGSAVEYPHGAIRLEGFKAAIKAEQASAEGRYTAPPVAGLKAGGTHWASWATSQEWFRQGLYTQIGLERPEDMIGFMQELVLSWDANNLLALAQTWQNNNVGNTPGFSGDAESALASIKAQVLYMPAETDMYFHIDALRAEAAIIPNVTLAIIPTLAGHLAGLGLTPDDANFINTEVAAFLQRED